MITLKKKEAFAAALKAFGPWHTWGRAQHLAYGLIRGVPYEKMERCANDSPFSVMFERSLQKLGAWPEFPFDPENRWNLPSSVYNKEAYNLISWVRKTPRKKKPSLETSVEASSVNH